jgi:DNA-binding MarR family transcriptional regulator
MPSAIADSPPLDATELRAWRGMLKVHARALAALDAELIRSHSMPMASYEVLLQLSEAGGSLRMGELARALLLSRSGLTRLVDRLAAQGLVVRRTCESDRRGSFAEITELGSRRFEEARPTHLAGIRREFISLLGDRDLENLASAWQRILGEPG